MESEKIVIELESDESDAKTDLAKCFEPPKADTKHEELLPLKKELEVPEVTVDQAKWSATLSAMDDTKRVEEFRKSEMEALSMRDQERETFDNAAYLQPRDRDDLYHGASLECEQRLLRRGKVFYYSKEPRNEMNHEKKVFPNACCYDRFGDPLPSDVSNDLSVQLVRSHHQDDFKKLQTDRYGRSGNTLPGSVSGGFSGYHPQTTNKRDVSLTELSASRAEAENANLAIQISTLMDQVDMQAKHIDEKKKQIAEQEKQIEKISNVCRDLKMRLFEIENKDAIIQVLVDHIEVLSAQLGSKKTS